MHKGRGDRRDTNQSKQHESRRRTDEAVDAMRGIDGTKKGECASSGQDRRYVGAGRTFDRHLVTSAADEFSTADQQQSKDRRHCEAQTGAKDTGFDAVADEEQTTQGQRNATDPNRPTGAQRRFYIRLARRIRLRGRSFRIAGGLRPGASPWPGDGLFRGIGLMCGRPHAFLLGRFHPQRCRRRGFGLSLASIRCRSGGNCRRLAGRGEDFLQRGFRFCSSWNCHTAQFGKIALDPRQLRALPQYDHEQHDKRDDADCIQCENPRV